jgi:hypothetical protein
VITPAENSIDYGTRCDATNPASFEANLQTHGIRPPQHHNQIPKARMNMPPTTLPSAIVMVRRKPGLHCQDKDKLSITPKNTLCINNRIGQNLDFFLSVVEIEARA